jgi:hypothetical protein
VVLKLPTPTDPGVRAVLDRQVQVMFECAEEVLADVTLEACLWQIDPRSWTVHQRGGRWFGELADEYPELPTPSLGWTMWHPFWWLGTLLAHTRDGEIPGIESVEWPGPDATLPSLRDLWAEWTACVNALDDAALRSGTLTRFPYADGRPFVYILGWAAMELTKNLSEMCVLRRVAHQLASG